MTPPGRGAKTADSRVHAVAPQAYPCIDGHARALAADAPALRYRCGWESWWLPRSSRQQSLWCIRSPTPIIARRDRDWRERSWAVRI
jgi:hypothetical protein